MSKGLSTTQLTHFHEQGYLIIEDVLSEQEIYPLRKEYEAILDRMAPQLVASGQLSQTYSELPFEERYTAILHELDDMYAIYQHLDISLPLLHDMPPDASLNAGPAVFDLLTNPRILDIVESLIGPEIYSNPIQHTRIKPPASTLRQDFVDANIAKTLWHQDEAVLTPDATETNILTVWIAITDATVENGCMVCVPGSHRKEMTLHCPGHSLSSAEIYIPEEMIPDDEVTPLPVKKGGVVLLHQRTEHGSLDNNSDRIRWSFDLRYHPVGQSSGRSVFPGFVARSAAHPETVLTDPETWASLWYDTRDRMVNSDDKFAVNERWLKYGGHYLCA